jgi:hypothetical protein
VCHTECGLAIYIKKGYLIRQKKKNYGKFKYNFTMQKYYESSKNPLKRNPKNPSRYYHNSGTKSQVSTQAKNIYHLSKILIQK